MSVGGVGVCVGCGCWCRARVASDSDAGAGAGGRVDADAVCVDMFWAQRQLFVEYSLHRSFFLNAVNIYFFMHHTIQRFVSQRFTVVDVGTSTHLIVEARADYNKIKTRNSCSNFEKSKRKDNFFVRTNRDVEIRMLRYRDILIIFDELRCAR